MKIVKLSCLVLTLTVIVAGCRKKYQLSEEEAKILEQTKSLSVGDLRLSDVVGERGRTRLHEAAYKGYWAVSKMLISKGADVHAKDKEGMNPLHWAKTKEIVELLLANGANVNAKGNEGVTALHWAVYNDYMEVIESLIAKGADVQAIAKSKEIPLFWAKSKVVAELLLAHGSDLNSKDIYGRVPLHWGRSVEIVEFYIAKGVDVNIVDAVDWAPTDWAMWNKRRDIVDALARHGGKPRSIHTDYPGEEEDQTKALDG